MKCRIGKKFFVNVMPWGSTRRASHHSISMPTESHLRAKLAMKERIGDLFFALPPTRPSRRSVLREDSARS